MEENSLTGSGDGPAARLEDTPGSAPSAGECTRSPSRLPAPLDEWTTRNCWKSWVSAAQPLHRVRTQLEQGVHRQTHHVPVVPVDRRHQCRPAPLDRVATGALAPLPALQVPLEQLRGERAERHECGGRGGALDAVLDQTQSADDLVGAPREHAQSGSRLAVVAGFAV